MVIKIDLAIIPIEIIAYHMDSIVIRAMIKLDIDSFLSLCYFLAYYQINFLEGHSYCTHFRVIVTCLFLAFMEVNFNANDSIHLILAFTYIFSDYCF